MRGIRKPTPKPKPKKAKPDVIRCRECAHAHLHQWYSNPVIALCDYLNDFGRTRREVADTVRRCAMYEHDEKPKTIEKHHNYE